LNALITFEYFASLSEIKYVLTRITFDGVEEERGGFGEQDAFASAGRHF
jgi:hypothetical protein